jgi:hypothetical protein
MGTSIASSLLGKTVVVASLQLSGFFGVADARSGRLPVDP